MAKITKEKFKTYANVFDEFTLRNLFKLASQGYFEELESPISIGKEANIFSAKTKDGKRVVVKIYRLETCDFKRMYDYIKWDPRFVNLRKKRREIVFTWAKREFRNLLKARKANVRVPKPIHVYYNILILEFIGKNNKVAPKIKDQIPESKKDIKIFYDETKEFMKKMYQNNLIHGDLSEFNILNFNNKPVLIDFSQATLKKSLIAAELLKRDIKNIHRFFKKIGAETSEEELFNHITGAQ